MNLERIANAVDVRRLANACIAEIGCGGSANLVTNFARTGVGRLVLIDPDTVSDVNMVRQDYLPAELGRPKVEALADHLRWINPRIAITPLQCDVTALDEDEWPAIFRDVDLIVSTTDSFAAQATANRIALSLKIPIVFPGIYAGGTGGELVFWRPGLPCYRCLVSARYRLQEEARAEGRSLDPPSDGTTIFDDGYIDAVAGMVAIGLITRRGKYAELVEALGDRNFLMLKLHPAHRWNGRDVIREQLGIAATNDRFFAWSSAARRNPPDGRPDPACPDCRRYGNGEP